MYMYVYIVVGKEVAEYCSRCVPEMLQSNLSYQSGEEVFLLGDRKLPEKDVIKELKCYGLISNNTCTSQSLSPLLLQIFYFPYIYM